MEASDPQQRACWHEYRSRLSSQNSEAEGPVNLRITEVVDEETVDDSEEEATVDEEMEEEDVDDGD